ncbi:MAG: deoxyribodipyrimidine photo-lyase [Rhodospirillales bacterium]|nr:deoxyribodipyrimidine photo-lyase [Rhodospirillales bacterium]
MSDKRSILWFRQDLRLSDNPALEAALQQGGAMLPLFVLDDESFGPRRPGAAQRWWMDRSLTALSERLAERGSRLILRRGPAGQVLKEVVSESGASALFWNRCYDPQSILRDRTVKAWAKDAGLDVRSFGGLLLAEPWEVATGDGGSYRVYSSFWRALSRSYRPPPTRPPPERLSPVPPIASDALKHWALRPAQPNWASGFADVWEPGETGAHRRLSAFLRQGLARYKAERDRPDRDGSSRLSPHLRFGEIAPQRIWNAVQDALSAGAGRAGADTFLAELGWREFSYHLLFHNPDIAREPLRPAFRNFPWRDDPAALAAWQEGRTGYPIVDAGMRQLRSLGWMHNRVRMIVASFLIKHLLLPWQLGEAWFWDTLLDADPANNTASWQWVAGCGTDAAPYFRIFNPVLQGDRFDPEGAYVRRWVPEISALPAKVIHKPWQASPQVLQQTGVRLGESYPRPLIDHAQARKRALEAYATVKQGATV